MPELDLKALGPLARELCRLINSRVGLALLFAAYSASPWGMGPKLDEIRQNTAMLRQVLDLGIQNSVSIARLVERCHITEK